MSLVDGLGREHTYLRVSVTDRCNFRCVYCMPADGFESMPRDELLSYEEIARLVRIFAGMGIQRVRLTGGEPLIRRDLERLVHELGQIPGITDIALTTNAHRLAGCAEELAASGLTRINVSLDSLDPERFSKLTRGGKLAKVLAGIEAAVAAGLTPVKINAVVLAGENEDELFDLVEYFKGPEYVLRFIEYMPFEARWHSCVPTRELRKRLKERWDMEPLGDRLGDGPAVNWQLSNGARVGFISPMSEKFCSTCNRLRLMADGHLRTCLSDDGTPSLRDFVRSGSTDEQIEQAIRAMVLTKREGHNATEEGGTPFEGVMTRVGG
jgi:GTP 3',8-cyclase